MRHGESVALLLTHQHDRLCQVGFVHVHTHAVGVGEFVRQRFLYGVELLLGDCHQISPEPPAWRKQTRTPLGRSGLDDGIQDGVQYCDAGGLVGTIPNREWHAAERDGCHVGGPGPSDRVSKSSSLPGS